MGFKNKKIKNNHCTIIYVDFVAKKIIEKPKKLRKKSK